VERRIARGDLEAAAELLDRLSPVAIVERARATHFVGDHRVEHAADLLHQRIRGRNLPIPERIGRRGLRRLPEPQLFLRTGVVAEAAICHRQRVADGGCLRISGDGRLEVGPGGRSVAERKGGTSEARERGGRSRVARSRLGEMRVGGFRVAAIELQGAQPDERRHIVGCERRCAPKCFNGPLALVPQPQCMTHVVGPRHLARGECRGVCKVRFRLAQELRRDEKLPHLPVQQRDRRRVRAAVSGSDERRVL
jgi:hypothetical protein